MPRHSSAVREYLQSPKGRAATLAIVLVASGAIVIPVAYWRSAISGVWAAATAWITCFFSGLLALWLVHLFSSPNRVLHQVLSGTLVRMSIPLSACLAVHVFSRTLADAGFLYYILAFYLITLAVETVLVAGTLTNQPSESQTG